MKQPPKGFDIDGAARDLERMGRRIAPIYGQPCVGECARLVGRNPSIAPAVLKFIREQMKALPGGGRDLDQPLFLNESAEHQAS